MQRYLLFDSGCAVCSGLARTVERETDGWLVARSLREPTIQGLLDRAHPGWTWQPTLLELDDENTPRTFTGLSMRWRLLRGLGPRRALRLARVVDRALRPASPPAASPERRRLLKYLGGVLALAALGRYALPAHAADDAAASALDPADPAITALKSSAGVQTAVQHFGAPDWSHVYRVTSAGHIGYLVKLPGRTALSIGNPAAHEDGKHLVSQVASVDPTAGEYTVNYTTVDKQLVGTVTYDSNANPLRSTTAAGPPPTTEVGDWGCLLQCLIRTNAIGVTGGLCGRSLIACLTGPEDPICDFAIACFLVASTVCLVQCAATVAPTPTPVPAPTRPAGPALAGLFLGDGLNGQLTLAPGKTSPTITSRFINKGFDTWRQNVFLAAYSTSSAQPVSTPWCNADPHYVSCGGSSPTLVKLRGDCAPGAECDFDYTITAPQQYVAGTTLRWRVCYRDAAGALHWIDGPQGEVEAEAYAVDPQNGGPAPAGYCARWNGDRYQGQPLSSMTLNSGQVSDNISVRFTDLGSASWDKNVVLAYWNGTDDGPPADGSQFCHDAPNDWYSCSPGIAAWIGSAVIPPGQDGEFEFQIQAPVLSAAHDFTLYFRPAHRASDGTYEWINQPGGARTYDTFNVHVNAGCTHCS